MLDLSSFMRSELTFFISISWIVSPSLRMLYEKILSVVSSPALASSLSLSCILTKILSTKNWVNGGVSTLNFLSSAGSTRKEFSFVWMMARSSPVVALRGTTFSLVTGCRVVCSASGAVSCFRRSGVGTAFLDI